MRNTVLTKESMGFRADFLRKSTLRIQLTYIVVALPFLINHMIHGRYLIALTSMVICTICAINTWSIFKRDHYPSQITLFGLVPIVIALLMLLIRSQGIVGMFSAYCAVIVFYFMLPERKAWIANIAILAGVLPVAWIGLEPNQTVSFIATFLLVSFFSAIFVNVIYSQQRQLHLLAATDTLTGLLNRTILYQSLEQAIAQSKRKGIPMTIVTFDIDHFKTINDSYGHDVGDDVLQNLGALLKQRVRGTDKVFRLGGEEFMVLLFDTDVDEGQKAAENLRLTIASTPFLAKHPVTVSLGAATLLPDENLTDWVKRSDKYLYIAKSNGRNRVIHRNIVDDLALLVDSSIVLAN